MSVWPRLALSLTVPVPVPVPVPRRFLLERHGQDVRVRLSADLQCIRIQHRVVACVTSAASMAVRPFAFAASLAPAACLDGWTTRTPYTMGSESSRPLDGQRPAPCARVLAPAGLPVSCSCTLPEQPRTKISVTLVLASHGLTHKATSTRAHFGT